MRARIEANAKALQGEILRGMGFQLGWSAASQRGPEAVARTVKNGGQTIQFCDKKDDCGAYRSDPFDQFQNACIVSAVEQRARQPCQRQRKDGDQPGVQKGAPDRGQPANDEQDLERAIQIESRQFYRAQTGKGPKNTRAAEECR